jgi:ubiquinone/menaquinone biosynthesis C-methylase UbiE
MDCLICCVNGWPGCLKGDDILNTDFDVETYYTDHWRNIDDKRLENYEKIFQWRAGFDDLLAPAGFAQGQVVVDYGCGPGFLSIELAGRVGPAGHVHGLDINEEFVRRARERVIQAELSERVDIHHFAGELIPLDADFADRALCKNVLEYVPDPSRTLQEIHRVLKPGGKVHITDSDWGFLLMDPLTPDELKRLMDAASFAFKTPLIGRKLRRLCLDIGYKDVAIKMLCEADTRGRVALIAHNMAGYAREGGTLPEAEIAALLRKIDDAVVDGTFLGALPQFLVTATK